MEKYLKVRIEKKLFSIHKYLDQTFENISCALLSYPGNLTPSNSNFKEIFLNTF